MSSRLALLLLSIVTLASCAKPLDLSLPTDKPLELHIYSQGSPVQMCTIAPNSPQFQQLDALLAANNEGWDTTLVTFVPSVLVTGDGFSINFLQGYAVVNYADQQLKRPMPASEYAFLECEDGT
jgi:hypothetical protein